MTDTFDGAGPDFAPGATTQTDTTLDPTPHHGVAGVPADGRAFVRLRPEQAELVRRGGALLVDIRRAAVRRAEGEVPGALVVAGPVREWRLGPDSPERVTDLGPDVPVLVLGDGTGASVLAASALRGHGLLSATDVVGGFAAWRSAGLPVCATFTLAGRFVTRRTEHDPVSRDHDWTRPAGVPVGAGRVPVPA